MQSVIRVTLTPASTTVAVPGQRTTHRQDAAAPHSVAAAVGLTVAEVTFYEDLELQEIADRIAAGPRLHAPPHSPPTRPSSKTRQLQAVRAIDADDDLRILDDVLTPTARRTRSARPGCATARSVRE